MLFQQPLVFLIPVGSDVEPLSMKFSFALLSPSDYYYLSLRILADLGARVFVALSTSSENQRCKWK